MARNSINGWNTFDDKWNQALHGSSDEVLQWSRCIVVFVKWSCPEIVNSVRELTWFMTEAFPNCLKSMECLMQDMLSMTEWGLVMQLDGHWDGGKEYEYEFDGISDLGM